MQLLASLRHYMESTPLPHDPLAPALIERVLEGLGLRGQPEPDLAGLRTLYAQWCLRVPFDNIRKLLHLRSIGSIKPVIGATAGYATRFCAADIGRRQAEMLRRQAEMLRRMSGRVIREQVRRRFGQPGGYFPAATAQRRSAGSPQPASLRVSSEFMPAPHRLPARTA